MKTKIFAVLLISVLVCGNIINKAKPINLMNQKVDKIPDSMLLDKEILNKINEMHSKNGASIYQKGYNDAISDIRTLLGMKPTFNGQTIYNTYKPLQLKNNFLGNNSICFTDTSWKQTRTEFKLNTSMWWTTDKGSMITIKYHSKQPYNFSIYHQPYDLCYDFILNKTIGCD